MSPAAATAPIAVAANVMIDGSVSPSSSGVSSLGSSWSGKRATPSEAEALLQLSSSSSSPNQSESDEGIVSDQSSEAADAAVAMMVPAMQQQEQNNNNKSSSNIIKTAA